jgi:hypothetical protein
MKKPDETRLSRNATDREIVRTCAIEQTCVASSAVTLYNSHRLRSASQGIIPKRPLFPATSPRSA